MRHEQDAESRLDPAEATSSELAAFPILRVLTLCHLPTLEVNLHAESADLSADRALFRSRHDAVSAPLAHAVVTARHKGV